MGLGNYWLAQVILALTLLTVSACSRVDDRQQAKLAEYRAKVQECRDSYKGKERVPIIGGGYLDVSKLAFYSASIDLKDGECGAVGFETAFYWTGEKIVPADPRFTGIPHARTPDHWRRLSVSARLGNRRKGAECQKNFDPKKCVNPNHKNPGPPPTWPEELVVTPSAYPDLDVRVGKQPSTVKTGNIHFFLRGWLRRDGVTPRTVNCFALNEEFPVDSMTPTQLKKLDFGKRTFPCQVEFWNFDFEGGAARIGLSTALLPDVTRALKGLQKYLSGVVINQNP